MEDIKDERIKEYALDIDFLLARASQASHISFDPADKRDTGLSSNSMVNYAYGKIAGCQIIPPGDGDDKMSCLRMFAKLPTHRKTTVLIDLILKYESDLVEVIPVAKGEGGE